MEFKSQEQLQSCIEDWKKILFLEDWIIKGVLVESPLLNENEEELCGQNIYQIDNRCATIRIVIPSDEDKNRILKFCAEETLVHELLHCKYNWLQKPDCSTMEYEYYDTMEHALLTQMAKSLIMAKYDLPYEWFKNF